MMPKMNGICHPGEAAARAEAIYQSGNCDAAIDLLVAATSQLPADRQLPLKLAQLLMDSNQYADALSVLEKMPADSNGYDVVALQGLCQAGMDDFENASQSAWQLQKSDRHRASASLLQGVLAFRQGDDASAEKFLRKTVDLDPTCAEAYLHLGLLKKRNRQRVDALASLQTGFDLAPTVRGVVLAYHDEVVAQSRFETAEKAFAKAIERYPGNQRLRYLYIDILMRSRRLEKAMDVILDCLAIFDPDAGLLDAALRVRAQLDASERRTTVESGQTLSLCMITRNEEGHLGKCLASARRMVDEIIIVDTGSADRTIDIAQAFGARVFEMRWQDDFAIARNYSLAQASGEWILVLDADEVIAPKDAEQIRSMIQERPSGRVAYAITTRNYTHQANLVGWVANDGEYETESAGSGWYPSRKVRLFKNDPDIRFRYPIHELVEPSLKALGIEIRDCTVPVHHYGKLDDKKNCQKALLYYQLGMEKLETLGNNPVALRELAVQSAGLGKHQEAAKLWTRLIAFYPDAAEIYVNLGTAYWNTGRFQNAAECAEKAIRLDPECREAHFNLALSHLCLGNTDRTIGILEPIILSHPTYLSAAFVRAAACASAGYTDKANRGFRRIREKLSEIEFQAALGELIRQLDTAGQPELVRGLKRYMDLPALDSA